MSLTGQDYTHHTSMNTLAHIIPIRIPQLIPSLPTTVKHQGTKPYSSPPVEARSFDGAGSLRSHRRHGASAGSVGCLSRGGTQESAKKMRILHSRFLELFVTGPENLDLCRILFFMRSFKVGP